MEISTFDAVRRYVLLSGYERLQLKRPKELIGKQLTDGTDITLVYRPKRKADQRAGYREVMFTAHDLRSTGYETVPNELDVVAKIKIEVKDIRQLPDR